MQTPAQLAEAAAQAVRSLNHATLPHLRGYENWRYPSDAYDVVGALHAMAAYLPQALEQIGHLVEQLHTTDQIRSDKGGDGVVDVHAALMALERARAEAEQVASRLTTAHNALSSLSWKE